jgi:hypothetical protein
MDNGHTVDGHVHLGHLLTDTFHLSSSKNRPTTIFRFHDEQTVNELTKIAWASVSCLERQHIYVYTYTYFFNDPEPYSEKMPVPQPWYNIRKTELTEKRNFRFFCKRKTETANLRLFAANGMEKRTFVFLGQRTINGNRRLLFQQTCPSMTIDMNHGHGHADDMDMHHGQIHGHAAWTWTRNVDIDMDMHQKWTWTQTCRTDMDMHMYSSKHLDTQHVRGQAPWMWKCTLGVDMHHGHRPSP